MAVAFGYAPDRKPGRALSSIHFTRKVAIFGCHSASLVDAPWDDPSWEFHGHATGHQWYRRQMDFYYDLHPPACWTRGGRKTALYPKWLAALTVPIYMQKHYPEVPASIQYPKRRVLAEFGYPRPYFTNHVAWIIALALTEGVTTIGLFGVNYGIRTEYQIQRACCEYWIGRAAARGVHIVLPEQSTLLQEPVGLYGYDSHDNETGARTTEYRDKTYATAEDIQPILPGQPGTQPAVPPEHLKEEIRLEELEFPRPDWALKPGRTDGGFEEENA